MTDASIKALFALLYKQNDGSLISSRMTLSPDRTAASHFIDAPRPVLSREDMLRPSTLGLMAEVERLLNDVPEEARDEVLRSISAIIADLEQRGVEPTEELSTLKYALH